MSSFFVTLALAAVATPPSDADLLVAAESAFAEGLRLRAKGERGAGAFRQAARAYEELRDRGAENPDLYRNLGNARLLAGDLPRAILAYRLGLRLAPADDGLRRLLTSAREQVVFAEGSALGRPVEEIRPGWLRAPRPGWLFGLAVVAYSAGCVCLTRWWMLRQGRLLVCAVVALAVAAGLGGRVAVQWWSGPPRPIVVVARDGVFLRKGNGTAFPPWFDTPLNRGVEAELVHESGGWLQVELPGGEVGWVSAAEVVR
jgi:hypothetical protein